MIIEGWSCLVRDDGPKVAQKGRAFAMISDDADGGRVLHLPPGAPPPPAVMAWLVAAPEHEEIIEGWQCRDSNDGKRTARWHGASPCELSPDKEGDDTGIYLSYSGSLIWLPKSVLRFVLEKTPASLKMKQ